MTTAAEGSPAEETDRSERGTHLREAIYGTIILLSVLAYLADHPISAAECLWTVAGTAIMLFAAQLYATRIAERITSGPDAEPPRLRHVAARMWPVAAVAAPAAVFLAIATSDALTTSTALAVDSWLAVAGLGVFAYAAARASHENRFRRLLSTASGLAVGLIIVILKAAL